MQGDGRRLATLVVGVVAFVLAGAACSSGGPRVAASGSPRTDGDAVVRRLAAIPPAVLHAVGGGDAVAYPLQADTPALARDGKPAVLYLGAEYCPYCAAERWALVVALSRFGRFSHLGLIHSASDDDFPDTATFTFHGATYRSDLLVFDTVEMATNRRAGAAYAPLERPTAEQRALMATYGGPPYFPPSSTGGIPFVDLAGRYLVSGASYDPGVLHGRSAADIADALRDPSSPTARAVLGAANGLTAAICGVTGNRPAPVCDDPSITGLRDRLR